MTLEKNVKQRESFVNSLLAQAMTYGVDKATIKREAFSSYATGNRRIEHNPGELTLTDIFNIAAICRMSPAKLIISAAENMSVASRKRKGETP